MATAGQALLLLGALSLARAWALSAPPVSPYAAGEEIDLRPEALSGELFRLVPGVGPVLAARLEEARQAAGGTLHAADLQAVPGLGPGLLSRWRSLCR